ncbi:hypothetical protein K7432_010740, partial [Basidiobolus ranarum]
FYPLFPATNNESNVDFQHLESTLSINPAPDVLILPSQLRYFVKNVENVVCVNPGQLTRKQIGGTFAKISIHPLPKETLSSEPIDSLKFHEIHNRTKVEIVRI